MNLGDSGPEHHLAGVKRKRDPFTAHAMQQVRDQDCLWSKDGQVRGSGHDQAERGERPGGGFVSIELNFLKPWGDRGQLDWPLYTHMLPPPTLVPGYLCRQTPTCSESFSS